ncbi:Arginine repressor [Candidatus Arcanobacter lacustris]|uniref:Arginine repressor n=1 Tax=Candidatus Arcanibacter lacustris TaxID=1607817 RepID=A0A0F5MNK3_9RICK|nr:Arginine repressor [Candidatus Arcanobacter lacustris]
MKSIEIDKNILIIIEKENCYEQQDIIKYLAQAGISLIQSNLSRRLKKLNIIKREGKYQILAIKTSSNLIKHIDLSPPNMLIIHTQPGNASAIASKIDRQKESLKGILGTIAGDDTIFAATNGKYSLELLKNQIFAII